MLDFVKDSVVGLLGLLGLLGLIALLAFLALIGLLAFFVVPTCNVAAQGCTKTRKYNDQKKRTPPQRHPRKERQRSRNEPKFSDDTLSKKIYCSQLTVHEFLDKFMLERMLARMGVNVLKFSLPKMFTTGLLRDKSPAWFDEYHPHASIVVRDIVVPMVRQILVDHGYVAGSGQKFSVAVIGDSTTAYCFDRKSNEVGGCEKWQLSKMVQEAMGTTDVYVGFFSSSGSSFCGPYGFLAQTASVVENEASFGCYDALLIVGGWNSRAVETSAPVRRDIFINLRKWALGT